MLLSFFLFFFFKQKTAYDMRISDWSSDVCSSDLAAVLVELLAVGGQAVQHPLLAELDVGAVLCGVCLALPRDVVDRGGQVGQPVARAIDRSDALRRQLVLVGLGAGRSEEHTSELQSLMRISYAVFCLKKKNNYD